jgi:hypothetical protein
MRQCLSCKILKRGASTTVSQQQFQQSFDNKTVPEPPVNSFCPVELFVRYWAQRVQT